MELWVQLEEELNTRFIKDSGYQWGDSVNLWRVMGSRTVVLRQYEESAREVI